MSQALQPNAVRTATEAEAFDAIYAGTSDVVLLQLIEECSDGLRQMRQAVLERRRERRAAELQHRLRPRP